MTCRYTLTITAKCPRDELLTDVYTMTVETPTMISVESILNAVAEHTKHPIYQEHLAEQLGLWLEAEVSLTGTHSGVQTEVWV